MFGKAPARTSGVGETSRRGGRLLLALLALPALAALSPVTVAAGAPGAARSERLAPLQPIRVRPLPVPAEFTSLRHPTWMPDGEHIVAAAESGEEQATHLTVMDRRGQNVRCLTCGLGQVVGPDRPFNTTQPLDVSKSFPFPDGRRVLLTFVTLPEGAAIVGLPGASRTAPDFNYAVLECAPSVLDCRSRELKAVELPGGGLSRGVQNREGRLAPDGEWMAWTQVSLNGTAMILARLVRGETTYTVADTRVLTPPRPPEGSVDPAAWNAAAPIHELKTFTPDGKRVLFSTFQRAENFDDFEMDLRTGSVRRLTSETEWDEDVSQSPNRRWLAVFASRGFDRMTPFSQFERPTYVDYPVFASTGRYMLKQQVGGGAGTCLLAPWLMSNHGQRGTYFGQPLDVGTKHFYPGPTTQWRPQGNAMLFSQYRLGEKAEEAGVPDHRAAIAWLPRVRASRLRPPPATVEPTWAPRLEDWQGYQSQQRRVVIPGKGGGTATVMLTGGTNFQEQSVTYDNYSDDGLTFIDGTERADSPFTVAASRWQADLRATGRNTGHLKADLTLSAGQGGGTLESVWNGRRYEGLPSATECQFNKLPRLLPRVTSTSSRGRKTVVKVRVRARVQYDPIPRPVHGASVRIAKHRARTNRRGRARLLVPKRSLRRHRIRTHSPGFRPGKRRITPARS